MSLPWSSPVRVRAGRDGDVKIRKQSGARAARWAVFDDVIERGLEFELGPRLLKLVAQAGGDAHCLEIPVSHLAERRDRTFGPALLFGIRKLASEECESIIERASWRELTRRFPFDELAEQPRIGESTAAHRDRVTTGLREHSLAVRDRADIAVADDGDSFDSFYNLADSGSLQGEMTENPEAQKLDVEAFLAAFLKSLLKEQKSEGTDS